MSLVEDNDDVPKALFQPPMVIQRYLYVRRVIEQFNESLNDGVKSVADFGCNDCRFVLHLKQFPFIHNIRCVDICPDVLQNENSRPKLIDYLLKRSHKLQIDLFVGSVAEKDKRFLKTDVVLCIELIEHLQVDMLPLLVDNIFGFIQPKLAIFTTPNQEYNSLIRKECMAGDSDAAQFRHPDHKFEWTRKEFNDWCENIISKYPNYSYKLDGVGRLNSDVDFLNGYCTQIAVFTKIKIDLNESVYPAEEHYKLLRSHTYG